MKKITGEFHCTGVKKPGDWMKKNRKGCGWKELATVSLTGLDKVLKEKRCPECGAILAYEDYELNRVVLEPINRLLAGR